jgi:hypothetical protein
VLLRLAYLGVTNALALLRLLPMSDNAKDAQIPALRHQITELEPHLHGEKIRFAPTDRAFLAALPHKLPRDALRRIRLLARPATVLRRHRDLITGRHPAIFPPQACRAACHRAFHPHAGAALGSREQRQGLPTHPR